MGNNGTDKEEDTYNSLSPKQISVDHSNNLSDSGIEFETASTEVAYTITVPLRQSYTRY